MLRLKLLGELTLEVDGVRQELPASRRACSLLGVLALERRAHPRGQLAARFWPDVLDESARTSLRSALSALRRALGADADRYLLATREAVALAGPDQVWTDVGEFEQLLTEGQLEDALELARGELLADLDDDWVYERRDEHRASVVALLERMAAAAEASGDLAAAVALTRRQVALDPLSEETHRELIHRLAANGDRSAALTTYRRLTDRFASELGIVPSSVTRELVERIRAAETTPQPVAALPLDPSPPAASTASDPPAPGPPVPAPAAERTTGTVTLLFTDQVGSTETLQRLGDEEGERLRRAHFGLLREAASMHGGEEVKNLGDGLMVAFVSAVDAVVCAITMQQAVDRARTTGELAFAVRIGLNVGEPIRDEGDYFGTPVVIAKRLCDAGAPGQILASELVRALIGTRGGFAYRALGAVALKGVADPVGACEVIWETSTEVRVPLPPLLAGKDRGTFVGRSDAAAALQAQWTEVRERGLRVVVLAGEPGIGKTRLVTEFARTAHDDGATVLAGSCHEETHVPYQPFVQALRHYIACCPPAELAVQVTPRRAQLAAILPELEDARSPYGPTGLGAEQERFRLFETVSSLLTDAAHLRPLVLFLDDLHWADQSSLLLLRHLARSAKDAPLMVLGTYRPVEVGDEHPLAEALAELRRSRAVERLSLSGLGEGEVAELIMGRTGQQAPRGFVRRVAERSEGNPFFIEELLHDVGAESDWNAAAGGVPDSVRDLLLRRLRGLGDDCRQALSVAAVAGRDFELDVLERVLEHPRDRLIDLIEEAIDADVLVELAQSVGRLSFSHALFRETIYEQLSATRKAAIHGRIAAAIEAAPTDRPDERAGTLAYHYRAAGELRKAFDYHRRAATAAERVHAQETALENLDGAIVAGEMLGMTAATDETMRDLYRARAWTFRLLGEPERALADLEHALEGAPAAGDRATELHVRNALGTHWHVLDPRASRRFHEEALGIAEELGDESGQVSALNRLSLVLANELEFAEAVELGSGRYRSPAAPATSLQSAALWTASSSPPCNSAISSVSRSCARSSSDPNAGVATCGICSGRCVSPATCRWSAATGRRPSGVSRRRSRSVIAWGENATPEFCFATRRAGSRAAAATMHDPWRSAVRRSQSRTRTRPTGSAGPRPVSRSHFLTCAPRSSPSLSWSAGLRPPSATVHAGRFSAASERSHRPHGWRVPRPRRVRSRSVRSRLPSRSPRHPATSTSGASRPTSRSPRPTSRTATSSAPSRQCKADCKRGSAAERRGRSRSPPVSWPAAPRLAETGPRQGGCSPAALRPPAMRG